MPTPVPLVNGKYYSFANIELRVGGLFFVGIKSINYGFKVGTQFVRGSNKLPIGLTQGQAEPRADFEMYLPQFNTMITTLGPGFMKLSLNLTVTYGNPTDNAGLFTVTDSILFATMNDIGADNSESLDATVRKVTLMPLRMLFNGVDPLDTGIPIGAIG